MNTESKPYPAVCPECRGTEHYYGILIWEGQEKPKCPNHKTPEGEERPVELEPVK